VLRVKRREFLIGTAASAAALAVSGTLACKHESIDFSRFKAFNAAEARTLDALLELLLPPSDGRPGAREVHVIDYFERELQKPDLKKLNGAVRYGMQALIHSAKRAGKENFADLTLPQQQEMVSAFATNQLHMGKEETKPIFDHVLAFSLEGYLCDPKYGGNFECKGWKAVGFQQGCEHG
jgi:gluconate 2-dehydrogenase gamma chain